MGSSGFCVGLTGFACEGDVWQMETKGKKGGSPGGDGGGGKVGR